MCVLFVAGVCSESGAILDFNARSLGPYSSLLNFKPKHEFSSWVTSLGFPDNSVIFGGSFLSSSLDVHRQLFLLHFDCF